MIILEQDEVYYQLVYEFKKFYWMNQEAELLIVEDYTE